MKSLVISEIALLSESERKARRESFDPIRTIVLGANDTGKSSLIKSIYQAFGADPAKVNPRWKAAEVKILLKFAINGVTYQILRDGSYFAIFNGAGNLLKSFTRVAELSSYLAELFAFGLVLASRGEQPEIPPPAYLFLPFYMDQDASWLSPWSSFAHLGQYAGWKDSLVEYHTGIRNNAYYSTSAELIRRTREQSEALGAERGVETVLSKLTRDTSVSTFSLDPATYDDRIKRLLAESQVLANKENELRRELASINSQAAIIRLRLDIAEKALGEMSADFHFLTDLGTDQVECPTCGNHYENDFVARFAIANDEDKVAQFIAVLRAELSRTEEQVRAAYARFEIARDQADQIQAILLETQGEITLQTVIESEGRKAADMLLSSQLSSAREIRSAIDSQVSSLREELKGLDKNALTLRRERTDIYAANFRKNCEALDVKMYSQQLSRELNPSIFETGSTLPRTLLAYQFAILDIIAVFTPATLCPIIIDSPNQQGQDGEHLPQILSFISDSQPAGTQLILGLENDTGIDFGGKTIVTPTGKQSLLLADSFQEVHDEIFGLIKKSLA